MIILTACPNDAGFIEVHREEVAVITAESASKILSVYQQRSKASQALQGLVREYELCPKLLGLEKSKGSCFLYQLGKCRGACVSKESVQSYNARLNLAFDKKRIREWPFNGPILLEEISATNSSQAFIVDKWCILGEIWHEDYCDPVVKTATNLFDLDTYKILHTFISSKMSKLRIKSFPADQLQAIMEVS